VALQAKRIALGAQQMIVVAAVGRVAGGAALHEGRLMVHRLLARSSMSVWQPRQMLTASVLGRPGSLLACGLWQSVQSPAGAGMRHLGESISLALSSWQVTHKTWRRAASAPLCRPWPARGRYRSSSPRTADA
jgi:hypothetical protein